MGNNFFLAWLFDLAIYGLVVLAIFLLLRAVMLWYWKIDKIVGYLKIIADHFERIDNIESEVRQRKR